MRLVFQSDYSIAPGETLKDTIEALGVTRKEMAKRLGMSLSSLFRILKGDQPVTYKTAYRLELVTGTPASLWNTLESLYRKQLAKI